MLKKSITYENLFTGEAVTEDHYFHLSKADLIEMEMEENKTTFVGRDGQSYTGLQAKLRRIVDAEDGQGIMEALKDWIRRSYGVRDGSRFRKSKEIWEDFSSTEAYSQMFFELCTNAELAGEFIEKIVPGDLDQVVSEIKAQVEAQEAAAAPATPEEPVTDPTGLTSPITPMVLTANEMIAMDSDELKSGLATGKYKLA